uniref:Small integral membrane protein 15 n=1 Tax=Steinernema glaseri TaxID=37863 RepID=A0A1I7Y8H9_9BILA
MVELSSGTFNQSIDNTVFILPALVIAIVMGFVSYKLKMSIQAKQLRQEAKKKRREERKEKGKLRSD